MRLLAVVGAVVALGVFLFFTGQENSSDSAQEEARRPVAEIKAAQAPPYRAPKVDGHTFNVEVVWWRSKKGSFFPETVAWTRHDLVNKPGLARLIFTSKGIRIKLSNPKAKAVKVTLWYAPDQGTTRRFSWHGKGSIPLIPLTKPILATDEKVVKACLVEIALNAYDPRFLGPRIKPRVYPGVVNIPPGVELG